MYAKFIALTVTALVGTTTAVVKKVYDNNHYDEDGYNKKGYDKNGYDRNGYYINGYDKKGYDRNGYDKNGYDINGYDINGYDKKGYDINGYDINGYDVSLNDRSYYKQKVKEMSQLLNDANHQMKCKRMDFALMQIRIGLEKGTKCLLLHNVEYCSPDEHTLNSNLNMCKDKYLLDNELISKLFEVKKYCNDNISSTEYNKAYFCCKVFEEFIEEIKSFS